MMRAGDDRPKPLGKHLGWSFRTHLIAFGLAIAIPVVVLALILFTRFQTGERQRLETVIADTTRNLAGDVERHLSGLIATLEALATSPALMNGDVGTFALQASRLSSATGLTILLRDMEGARLIDTRLPAGLAGPPISFGEADKRALDSGLAVVSGLPPAPIDGTWSVAVRIAVPRGPRPTHLLGILVPSSRLAEILRTELGGSETVAGLADAQRRVVATTRRGNTDTGRDAPFPAGAEMGHLQAINLEGRPALMAVAPVSSTGWTLWVGVTAGTVDAAVHKSLGLLGLAAVSLVALSLGLALLFGRRLAEPVRLLAVRAERIHSPASWTAMDSDLREANEVADALARTSRTLSERTATLERTVAELVGLYRSAPVGIALFDRDGVVLRINPWLAAATGVPPEADAGRRLWDVLPSLKPLVKPAFEKVLATGQPVQDIEVRGDDGRHGGRRDYLVTFYPVTTPGGVSAVGVIVEDVTERKQREAQQHYLMRELTHRTKNLLSVVQAMAQQIARTSPSLEDFTSRFSSRLQSLAGSHDLLVQQNWAGADMADLVRSQLGHHADGIGGRIKVDGPRVRLSPDAAQNIGMALHELATNAVKHGALATEGGGVLVNWSLDDGHFRLVWRETGVDGLKPPERLGFGHTVTTRVVARALDGTVTLDYPPGGVVWTLSCPAVSNGVERVTGYAQGAT
ncbi:sensor histidine kinase [Alsobacter sp. R-9]